MSNGKYEPAFPAPELGERHYGDRSQYSGITIRDYFAAKAMQGIIPTRSNGYEMDTCKLARWSYAMADAMLREREK